MKGFSRAQHYLGEFGNGSKMKYVANLMVAIHNVSAGEAFALGIKAGLTPKAIFDVQANSAGTSRMFQVRGPMMVKGRYDDVTMKNEVWQKDMKIIGDFARSSAWRRRRSTPPRRSTRPRWRRASRSKTPARCARCWRGWRGCAARRLQGFQQSLDLERLLQRGVDADQSGGKAWLTGRTSAPGRTPR